MAKYDGEKKVKPRKRKHRFTFTEDEVAALLTASGRFAAWGRAGRFGEALESSYWALRAADVETFEERGWAFSDDYAHVMEPS